MIHRDGSAPRALRIAAFTGFALVAAAYAPVSAQYLGGGTKSAAEVQVADLEDMRTKFAGLARAFPADKYEWRPMQGVRSVREVMALIAAEGVLFPTMWSYEKPAWVPDPAFGAELGRLARLSRDELIREVERSFDHVIGVVKGMSATDRSRQVNFFGLNVDLASAVTLMANDMHEHLGQAIAYARMNQIVPPWSRPQGAP